MMVARKPGEGRITLEGWVSGHDTIFSDDEYSIYSCQTGQSKFLKQHLPLNYFLFFFLTVSVTVVAG
jgi:hypothetical protein